MKKLKYIIVFALLFYSNLYSISAEKPISGRTYTIKSAVATNKFIDLYGFNTKNETNIQLYTNNNNNNNNNQKWIFTLQNDGYYTISSSINQNKVLDIYGGILKNSSNVQLYDNTNKDNQKWQIKYVENGYVNIIAKGGNYCLDVYGGKTSNGTNIQIYKCQNNIAQKFKIIEDINVEKTIEDGTYILNSALDESKVLDVNSSSTTNGTNVELFSNKNGINQKWSIKYLNNGYYSISSKLNDNKCLDIYGGNFIPETNVQIYTCKNTDNQKWIIKDAGNGYYNLITAGEHMYLDVYSSSTKDRTNIQVYHGNNELGQKFKLNKIDDIALESGMYTIKTNLDTEKSLDIYSKIIENNTPITLFTSNNNNNQKWYITKLNNGYYTIKSASNSNLYLSTTNISTLSTNETQWELIYYAENKYYIKEKESEKYLSIENSKSENGTNIILSTSNNSNAQIFYITKTEINYNDRTITDGCYTINSSLNQNKVLDIYNSSRKDNSNIQLYQQKNTNNQLWYFTYLDNGYYSITSALNPNVSLTNSNNNVSLYKFTNSDTQQWKLIDDGNGSKIIISKNNNTCIDLTAYKTDNETNIQTYSCNYQSNQKFKLTKYTNQKTYTGIDVSKYQGNIDWAKIASSNIGFVMLRAGWGDNWTSQDDTKFTEYVAVCEKYNIPYGVYLYSYAKNVTGSTALNANSESATSEAEHVLRLLKSVSYKPNLKTSVYIDMEDSSTQSLGKTKLTQIADKFCSTVQANGYGCGIYANTSWLTNYLDSKSLASKYDIWLAEWPYGSSPSPSYTTAMTLKPSYNLTNYKLWQFSSRGSIGGISGNVDVDLGYDIFD